MEVFESLKQVVKNSDKKKIVFPEGKDVRILKAVERLEKENLVEPILLGEESEIQGIAKENEIDISNIKIIDYLNDPKFEEINQKFFDRVNGSKRFKTLDDTRKALKTGNYYGTMLVYLGLADGMVSGAAHSTADTVRPALTILKTKEGMHRVSGSFILERGEEKYIFADCAITIDPAAEHLAEFAEQCLATAKIIDIEPRIAFLSFSTHGSAAGEQVEKVATATKIFKEKHPDVIADGELQFDAAFVPQVAKTKAPDSPVAGKANIFIFPELQSGNIGYKIAQRLGKFSAVGPILQGLAKPVNDLSRGCNEDDVYKMGILTAAQATIKD